MHRWNSLGTVLTALQAIFVLALLAEGAHGMEDGLFEAEETYMKGRSDHPHRVSARQAKKCKTYPTDSTWPSLQQWHDFNTTLEGALIQTVPEASPCYSNGSALNSSECQSLSSTWGNSTLRIEDPTSIRSVLFQGMSCMPPAFAPSFLSTNSTSKTCALGAYPDFVVKATDVAQIQKAINFAREHNIRLVIKNTGHDFGAKSVGKGALSIWTHFLKQKSFNWYEGEDYAGPSVKLGAGVQAYEAYAFAKRHDVTLVGGEGKVRCSLLASRQKV
jgi:hypothetical protein